MTFHSILFLKKEDYNFREDRSFKEGRDFKEDYNFKEDHNFREDHSFQKIDDPPEFFHDLYLDQVINTITAEKQEYHLQPFFYMPLQDVDSIAYRHEVMQDLEQRAVFDVVQTFAQGMRMVRKQLALARKFHYPYQKERWFLDAIAGYCDSVTSLLQSMMDVDLQSRGLLAFRSYIKEYVFSSSFLQLQREVQQLQLDLAAIRYCVRIKGNAITVLRYEEEPDYSAQVEETFAKFKQGAVKNYLVQFPDYPEMNHIEASILDGVAHLYPEIFSRLDSFSVQYKDCLDETIVTFDREIQFYLSYLEHMALFKRKGLSFCYPRISESKEISAEETFDLALANVLLSTQTPIICNDFFLQGRERIFVVTGPNQGGKTTFARIVGQLHYLGCLGCPVPGKHAELFLFDHIFTHFEREETVVNLRGKLQDDLYRMHQTLEQATPRSLIIMNEVFNSTTFKDALFLSEEILRQVIQLDVLAVCVTFLDELTTLSEKTVSMTSTVVPGDLAQRTYKIIRKPADGLAYAIAIAEKYQLTYAHLKERLQS